MAGITPDPKKRDYLLPPGCKDLIDVLQLRGRGDRDFVGAHSKFTFSHGGEERGGFPDIEKYVALVYESTAFQFTLAMTPPGQSFTFRVSRFSGEEMLACVSVEMNSEQEAAARSFFMRHNLPTPENTEMPASFIPDLPVHIEFAISPAPPEATHLARLAADLFQEVCGLGDEASLSFRYQEVKKAASRLDDSP
jgi:hypothetical protein